MICGPRSASALATAVNTANGREAHHIIGDLEHHPDERFDAADDRLARLADGGQRDAEEQARR